ncbi:hypothetical protein IQ22_04113 [Pseudomonas duriflava]|uniref:Uncharacterized protein n=1 Tax=Pseudomonas duriflava TaxID=459528 RepID=A0A562PX42_9PSED|nr:hypothetical protein [Pseudomonas duriflava]TWI48979.1 hypothetical protein IQ22_04113 [Pseudomonas duriflava]
MGQKTQRREEVNEQLGLAQDGLLNGLLNTNPEAIDAGLLALFCLRG